MEERTELGIFSTAERTQPTLPGVEEMATPSVGLVDDGAQRRAPPTVRAPARDGTAGRSRWHRGPSSSTRRYCYNCGNTMQRAGSCYVCGSCGSTSGCS